MTNRELRLRADVVAEVCAELLADLPRADQRQLGERYITGLLTVDGRKSIRRIAGAGGGPLEQSLHHFISKSAWDWIPVRRRLAAYLERVMAPDAIVVSQLSIPKSGPHSVGVARGFDPVVGRTVNRQLASGLWLAASQAACPIDWQLFLPSEWMADTQRRSRADIPSDARAADLVQGALDAVTSVAPGWGLPPYPIVWDLRDGPALRVAGALAGRDLPFLLAVSGSTKIPGSGSLVRQVIGAPAGRQPVLWRDSATGSARQSLTATATVPLPGAKSSPVAAVGVWHRAQRWPTELWLTNLPTGPMPMLLRIGRLADRVAAELADASTRVGLQGFEGRSFRGWHHHVTLASVAQAIRTRAPFHDSCAISRLAI